jgi:hypothetical protein
MLAGLGGVAIGASLTTVAGIRRASAATAALGLDYAWTHPSTSSIKAAGYTFVCRYLSWDSSKNLTPEEASQLQAAGIAVVCNWEADPSEALQGYAQGVKSATEAARQASNCGQPADRPIYFSVDFDATPDQQAAINSYFDGVASVIGSARCGVYAGYYVVQRLFDAGKVSWGWQTFAWSGGLWDSRAQLRQTQNDITVGGVACDRDEATAADFGQWGAGSPNITPLISTDGVSVLSDGRIALYDVRSDGNVWGKSQASAGSAFGSWQQLSTGGGYAGKVAVLRDSDDRITLYVRRNGTVWGASQSTAGGSLHNWVQIGTNGAGITGDPTAVYGVGGLIAIYVTSSAGDVAGVDQVSAGGSFGSWQVLSSGGGYTGKPAAIVDGSARISLYVRRNGTVWGASQSTAGGSLHNWVQIGTNGAGITGDPAAVHAASRVIALYARISVDEVSGVNQTAPGGSFGSWQRI